MIWKQHVFLPFINFFSVCLSLFGWKHMAQTRIITVLVTSWSWERLQCSKGPITKANIFLCKMYPDEDEKSTSRLKKPVNMITIDQRRQDCWSCSENIADIIITCMYTLPHLKSDSWLRLVSNGNNCVAWTNQEVAIVIMSKFGRQSFKAALKCAVCLLSLLFPTATIRKRRRKR